MIAYVRQNYPQHNHCYRNCKYYFLLLGHLFVHFPYLNSPPTSIHTNDIFITISLTDANYFDIVNLKYLNHIIVAIGVDIQFVILLCHEVRHLFQGQTADHFSGIFIQLVEVIILCGKAIAAEDHISFYEEVHAVVGLVGAPPHQLLIFQIIGKHKTGVRLGIAVHYRSPIEDSVLKAGVVAVDVPFVCGIFQYRQAVSANAVNLYCFFIMSSFYFALFFQQEIYNVFLSDASPVNV